MLVEDLLAITQTATPDGLNTINAYQRIYTSIRRAIIEGHLPKGTKLPASRVLAAELGLSRSTVVNAYDWLKADGLLNSTPGGATYVSDDFTDQNRTKPTSTFPVTDHSRSHLSKRSQSLLTKVEPNPERSNCLFLPGLPDLGSFPEGRWMKAIKEYSNIFIGAPHDSEHIGGYGTLRQAIADHLNVSRGVVCNSDQIIVTNSFQASTRLIFTLMSDEDDAIFAEEACYHGIKSSAAVSNLVMHPLSLDKFGATVPEKFQGERLSYLTPSHQFPVGMQMSIERRNAHIEQARKHNMWILEDDYDCEFPSIQTPLPAMMALSGGDNVIYLGSFSKSLSPYLRISYIVVPNGLKEAFRRAATHFAFEPPFATQAALAEFIEEGHFNRHIRKMRNIYGKKRTTAVNAIDQHLARHGYRIGGDSGLHITIIFRRWIDDKEVCRIAADKGLGCMPLSESYIGSAAQSGLVLGYGHGSLLEIENGIKTLAKIVEKIAQKKPLPRT